MIFERQTRKMNRVTLLIQEKGLSVLLQACLFLRHIFSGSCPAILFFIFLLFHSLTGYPVSFS